MDQHPPLKALPTRSGRGLGVLLLAWAALVCVADATSALRDAQDVMARNVLRACFTAIEEIRLEDLEPAERLQALEGKPCTAVPGLKITGLTARTFPASRITLHPEAQEEYQVQVTSPTGRAFVFPERLTPRPPVTASARPQPLWLNWSQSLLILGLLTALLVWIPHLSGLGWIGALLLLLGGSFLWSVSTHPPTAEGVAQVVFLLYWNTWVWLLLSLTTGTLRRVVWSGTESWFQALGAGLVWAALPSPSLTISVLGMFHSVEDQAGFTSLLAATLISAAVLLAFLVGAHLFPWRSISRR